MAYVGNEAQTAFTSFDRQSLTGDGTTGPYTLSHAVANEQEIEVFVNYVRQRPGEAYTVSGDQMTMTGYVLSTDDFYVVFQGKALQTVVPPDGSITSAMFSSGLTLGGGTYKGENGEVNAGGGDIFRVHQQTLDSNVTIDSDENALCAGPLTVASTKVLTVNGNLVIA